MALKMKRTLLTVTISTIFVLSLLTACVPSEEETASYYAPKASANPNDHTVTVQTKSMDIDMRNTLVAEGTGKVTIMPDVVYVKTGVSTFSSSQSEAEGENNRIIDIIKKEMETLEIHAEDIRVVEYNVIPNKAASDDDPKKYEVRKFLEIKLRDTSKTGDVLEAVINNGANLDYEVRYDIENREEIDNQALKLALENASDKAKIMSEAAGVELVDITLIAQEIVNDEEDTLTLQNQKTEKETIFSSKEISITAKAKITYEIKPKQTEDQTQKK